MKVKVGSDKFTLATEIAIEIVAIIIHDMDTKTWVHIDDDTRQEWISKVVRKILRYL